MSFHLSHLLHGLYNRPQAYQLPNAGEQLREAQGIGHAAMMPESRTTELERGLRVMTMNNLHESGPKAEMMNSRHESGLGVEMIRNLERGQGAEMMSLRDRERDLGATMMRNLVFVSGREVETILSQTVSQIILI